MVLTAWVLARKGSHQLFGFSSFRFLSFASCWKSAKGLQKEIPGVYVSDTGRGKASAGSFDVFCCWNLQILQPSNSDNSASALILWDSLLVKTCHGIHQPVVNY